MDTNEFRTNLQAALQAAMPDMEIRVVPPEILEEMMKEEHTDEADIREMKRQAALSSIRREQAKLLYRYDLLRKLEDLIGTPDEERKPEQLLEELAIAIELRMS